MMVKLIGLIMVVLLAIGCLHQAGSGNSAIDSPIHPLPSARVIKMSSPIAGLDYFQLFAAGQGAKLLETQASITNLEQFVRSPEGTPYDRVIVAQLLYNHQGHFLLSNSEMAELHAAAIGQAPMHNPWGLPGEPVDFGAALLKLGDSLEPAFKPLLENSTLLKYFGSEEPTLASMYKYRVSDLAAGLIAVHQGISLIDHRDPKIRDQWIRENVEPLP